METNSTNLIRSFAGGFILGYLSGYFIRKGLKLFLILMIFLAVIIHMTDLWESLVNIWSLIGRFLTNMLMSAVVSLKDMLGIQTTSNAFSIGFLTGLGWSLVAGK